MPKTLLKKVGGNKYANHSFFRPYLSVYEDMIVYTKRHHILLLDEITIPYAQIARVTLHKGVIFSKLEFAMAGGGESIFMKGVWNRPARKIKLLIDDKIYHEQNKQHFKHGTDRHIMEDINQSLGRLKELLATDRITEKEYEKQKRELLKQSY